MAAGALPAWSWGRSGQTYGPDPHLFPFLMASDWKLLREVGAGAAGWNDRPLCPAPRPHPAAPAARRPTAAGRVAAARRPSPSAFLSTSSHERPPPLLHPARIRSPVVSQGDLCRGV